MDFRFGYIKIPPPKRIELLTENLGILCELQICLHQITPPPPQKKNPELLNFSCITYSATHQAASDQKPLKSILPFMVYRSREAVRPATWSIVLLGCIYIRAKVKAKVTSLLICCIVSYLCVYTTVMSGWQKIKENYRFRSNMKEPLGILYGCNRITLISF